MKKPRPTPSAAALPLHPSIAARAHDLWCRHGHPANRDDAIWLEASFFIFVLAPVLGRISP